MTQDTAPQGLLILTVPPSLEEMLVDELLQQTAISGFTSSKVNGRGRAHGDGGHLNIGEQVTGRRQRVQFMTHAAIADLQNLVSVLKVRFRSSDIHYILMPVLEC